MAAAFLASHGIDIDSELHRIQFGQDSTTPGGSQDTPAVTLVRNASLPNTPSGSTWDIYFHTPSFANGKETGISSIKPHDASSVSQSPGVIDAHAALLAPSLCHPHIHLDKPYLLSHPKYSHLQVERGDFAEAMELTGQAKANFAQDDLLERGQRAIDESVAAGVTHIRAFVEVDAGVQMKCLDAGIELKRKAKGRCEVQICAFAQLPLFSSSDGDENGSVIRGLMTEAAERQEVDVMGSTPYVESDREKQKENVRWIIDLAIKHQKHLDLHLDYNLDPDTPPLVHPVVDTLHKMKWTSANPNKTILLGHCTRLTLFSPSQWHDLRSLIADLPLYFVGLPTSDLYMMRPAHPENLPLQQPTLYPGKMIQDYGLKCCLGVNNIGNAFTPQGSCDPLTLACQGVGVYQLGTRQGTEMLYACVGTLAREAIGLGRERQIGDSSVREGDGDLVLFAAEEVVWTTRRTVSEVVYLYDLCRGRRGFLNGRLVS
ncbi:hypothetical protein LTR62_001083 [Meristemomyces frigidus]|uniref:Metallo-dependent hydrolase n=1 Tax=Meristemomyces frigidus TaxID=1508187 RepID=A0AAN7YBX0_9PEZI|nr:hypothetical protein LTR62_001083 [Meristemomyces frigidus]